MANVLIGVLRVLFVALVLNGGRRIWDYLGRHFINAAAAAHDPNEDGAGRVYPAGPPRVRAT